MTSKPATEEKTAGSTEAGEDEVSNAVFDKHQAVCKSGMWQWEGTLREEKMPQESPTTPHCPWDLPCCTSEQATQVQQRFRVKVLLAE